ncbi:MAG: hypothetical protein ACREM2_00375 [Vulcanimicrobiaceae bacterium]
MKRFRRLGSFALGLLVAAVVCVVAVQLAGIVAKRAALANELAATHAQIAALRAKSGAEAREIARLRTPAGAIPAIHRELEMVGPHEQLIYLRNFATPAPWNR